MINENTENGENRVDDDETQEDQSDDMDLVEERVQVDRRMLEIMITSESQQVH